MAKLVARSSALLAVLILLAVSAALIDPSLGGLR
jgi:hypothetical protein